MFKGFYPSILKTTRVVPVFINYRPITNLSSLNKIFEKLIYERIINFISKYNIIKDIQFGFRKNCSTTTAIFTLLNDFFDSYRHSTFTIAIFLDLSKAFDVIDRQILLNKLDLYGFRGIVGKFLASYLTNRSQYVTCDGYESDIKDITYGVPQGSILGPVFFNLFINDFSWIPIAKKVHFADDSVFYVSDSCLDECLIKIKKVITYVSDWLNNNRLIINLSKTKLMMISPNRIAHLPSITFEGTELEWVNEIKYLGVYIDSKLNFNSQLKYVSGRLSKLNGVIYSMSNFTPRDTLLNIYFSLVYPVIIQSIIIWGGVSENKLNKIATKQNKIIRQVYGIEEYRNRNLPTSQLYKELKILKVNDIYRYFMIKFVHFILYQRFDLFIKYFSDYLPQSNYILRNSVLNLPQIRTEKERFFTIFRCCELIRELPSDFVSPQSNQLLKKRFMEYVLSRY